MLISGNLAVFPVDYILTVFSYVNAFRMVLFLFLSNYQMVSDLGTLHEWSQSTYIYTSLNVGNQISGYHSEGSRKKDQMKLTCVILTSWLMILEILKAHIARCTCKPLWSYFYFLELHSFIAAKIVLLSYIISEDVPDSIPLGIDADHWSMYCVQGLMWMFPEVQFTRRVVLQKQVGAFLVSSHMIYV